MTEHSTPESSAGSTPESEAAAFARLVAADPASGHQDVNLSGIRAEVLAAAAAEGEPKRRRSMLLAAGAAASVAVLAGAVLGGVVLGRATSDNGSVTAAVAPVAEPANLIPVVGGPGLPGAMGNGADAPTLGTVSGQGLRTSGETSGLAPASSDAKMSMPWWGGGSTVFTADPSVSGETPGPASGYLVSAAGVDRSALAAQLAAEFGVAGSPRTDEWGNVSVGPADGSGPAVWVSSDALASWSYYNPSIDPWRGCVTTSVPEPMPVEDSSAAGSSGSAGSASASSDPVAPDQKATSCEDLPMPDRDRSERSARALLAGIGVAKDDVQWDVSESAPTLYVQATQLVGGQPGALAWSFTFADSGLLSASGTAAGVQEYTGYPVVSPREAVERTADPRWRGFGPTLTGGGATPMPAVREATDPAATPSAAPLLGGRPAVQVPLTTVTLSGGEAGLAQYWQPDGSILLLPAYTFTDADDLTWSVIAVAEAAVQFGE